MCEVARSYNSKVINVDQVAFPSNRSLLTSSQQIWTKVEKLFADKIKLKKVINKKQKLMLYHIKQWRKV